MSMATFADGFAIGCSELGVEPAIMVKVAAGDDFAAQIAALKGELAAGAAPQHVVAPTPIGAGGGAGGSEGYGGLGGLISGAWDAIPSAQDVKNVVTGGRNAVVEHAVNPVLRAGDAIRQGISDVGTTLGDPAGAARASKLKQLAELEQQQAAVTAKVEEHTNMLAQNAKNKELARMAQQAQAKLLAQAKAAPGSVGVPPSGPVGSKANPFPTAPAGPATAIPAGMAKASPATPSGGVQSTEAGQALADSKAPVDVGARSSFADMMKSPGGLAALAAVLGLGGAGIGAMASEDPKKRKRNAMIGGGAGLTAASIPMLMALANRQKQPVG